MRSFRSRTGSLPVLGFVALLPLLAAIGAFGVDLMHFNSAKGELQRSVDAGALAGALQLYNPDQTQADRCARFVTEQNWVDGFPVDQGHGAQTNVTVTWPTAAQRGTVFVQSQIPINSLLAHIFGNHSQIVTASALAGPSVPQRTALAGQIFPFALFWDRPAGAALNTKHIGDPVHGDNFLAPQAPSTGEFTGFTGGANAANVKDYMTGFRHPETLKGSPPVTIGTNISLCNGNMQSCWMQLDTFKGQNVLMPVIDQNGKVLGFLGVKITSTNLNGSHSYFDGVIVHEIYQGADGTPPPGPDPQTDAFFNEVTPLTVKLLN